MSKATVVARALTARTGLRVLRFITIIVTVVFGLWLLLTIGLVYLFSPWWWLLLVPALLLFIVMLIVRLIITLLIKRIHTAGLTKIQNEALDRFVDKIQSLLEARATPPWVFALICIKDLVLHRDITTVKSLVSDTASLRRDYQALETLF